VKVFSGRQALSNLKNNRHGIWARGGDGNSPGPDPDYAANRVSKPFAEVHGRSIFALDAQTKVFAIGSCFAREIEGAFARRGFQVLSNDDPYLREGCDARPGETQVFNPTDFPSESPWGPGNYVNRYTTVSMLQELQRSIGGMDLPDDALLYETGDGKFIDLHFEPSVLPGNPAAVQRRRAITKEVTRRIETADLVVVTLGLVEAWYDRSSAAYVNSAPNLRMLHRAGDRFEMRRLDFHENLAALLALFELVRGRNSTARFVLTVSPVPLEATFTDDDVVVANAASKAVLRAVADEVCARHADVLYFPSFEIVNLSDPSLAWEADRRHVTRPMVEFILESFQRAEALPNRRLP
jgi:hypothetical protein